MRGFKMFKCLALLILSLCWTITEAQTLPAISTAPTPVEYSICTTCLCTTGVSVFTVNCENMGLTSIPADELQELADGGVEVSEIDLSSNKITLVRANDFYSHGGSLITIDLRRNEITEIEDEAFAFTHLKKLFVLQLSNNKLKALPVNAFRMLELNILDLRSNMLTSVPKALAKTTEIVKLHLQNNPINNLAYDSFDGIRGVSTLDVSNCGLSAFEACKYDYQFFSGLNTLYLDQNRIAVIKSEHFVCADDPDLNPLRLGVLRVLSIQESGVTRIEDKAFKALRQLVKLFLNGNNLGIFRGQVFYGLRRLEQLDLAHCNITDLKRVVFKELGQLEYLFLDGNNIEVIHHRDFTYLENRGLRSLNLASSKIKKIVGQPFENLTQLGELNLENNQLDDRSSLAFGKKGGFHRLQLSHNNFQHVPNFPSKGFPYLRELELENNSIIELRSQDIQNMTQLTQLTLRNNGISYIEENAFADADQLIFLDLDNLKLQHLPTRMHLPNLHVLHIKYGELESLPDDICQRFPHLQIIEARHNQITRLPSFERCSGMEYLDFAYNNLTTIHHNTLSKLFHLRLLQLDYNRIENITEDVFRDTGNLEFLHLQSNNLTSLPKKIFNNATLLVHVDLSHNQLETLENGIFLNNAKHLHILELNNNRLKNFSSEILPETSQLYKLNLSSNNLDVLRFPLNGLLKLTEFFVENNFDLFQVPDVVAYPNLTNIKYTYAYHCCIWSEVIRNVHTWVDHSKNNTAPPTIIPTPEPIKASDDDCVGGEFTDYGRERWMIVAETFDLIVKFLPNCFVELIIPEDNSSIGTTIGRVIPTFNPTGDHIIKINHGLALNCSPGPNELSPCANLIDPWPLRLVVWFLWIVALLGNGAVLFISIATKEKLEVYQFLICCLAFANFCMGVYLAFLSAVDIRTYGEISFYQSALYWQNGPGCKAAGFIAVFASELSVFILVLLTLERVHTIRYTFNTNEKGKMNVAITFSVIAVLLSAILATLPLVGINSYSKVSVCLPYVTEKWTDKAYIGVLLSSHLVGFLIILFSYVYIFRNICKSPAAQQKKKEISVAALKIAILIITAFVCWIPLVVIGYLALGDIKAVNTAQAKYLIVLVYPLNACLNPFIYALFTRQFRQKISLLLKRDRVGTLPPTSRRFPLNRGSSAFLPNSPRNPSSPLELINLRQGRRSNSLSVHLPAHHTSSPPVQSPPSLSPPPGVYMGRRASLPATFGSSIRTLQLGFGNSQNGSMTSNNSTVDLNAHPFNFAPGYGAAASQDITDAEIPVAALPTNLNNSLGGSQDSSNRQLPGIPEEQEDENQSVCSADFHDAQEEVREDETEEQEVQPIEVDSELSGVSSNENSMSVTLNSPLPERKRLTEGRKLDLREGTDSAYSGCYSSTPDIAITSHHVSPEHSCSISRRSESFSSYDLAVSDFEISSSPIPKKGKILGATPILLDDKQQQSDLDTCLNCNSLSHDSRGKLKSLQELAQRTNDHSVSQLSVVGSETSI